MCCGTCSVASMGSSRGRCTCVHCCFVLHCALNISGASSDKTSTKELQADLGAHPVRTQHPTHEGEARGRVDLYAVQRRASPVCEGKDRGVVFLSSSGPWLLLLIFSMISSSNEFRVVT